MKMKTETMQTKVEKKKFEDLKFVRVTQALLFRQIPKYLFEQIKDRSFDIDRLYRLSDKIISDLMQLFYVLVDDESKIKGVFWASANIIHNSIDVTVLSIDKEYQFSDAIKRTVEFIDTFQKDATIRILVAKTAAYEKAGFKKKEILMEYHNVKE